MSGGLHILVAATSPKSSIANQSYTGRSRGGGRGAYYKAKYGGGGRGRSDKSTSEPTAAGATQSAGPRDWDQLQRDLKTIDGQQYGEHSICLFSSLLNFNSDRTFTFIGYDVTPLSARASTCTRLLTRSRRLQETPRTIQPFRPNFHTFCRPCPGRCVCCAVSRAGYHALDADWLPSRILPIRDPQSRPLRFCNKNRSVHHSRQPSKQECR
jgi:hypothetical protein